MPQPKTLTPEQYESLGRMTQSLLHAVNNSLASITGFAEFLMEDLPQDSQAHSFAGNIHQSGQHLKKLVEQVRTINSAPRIALIEDVDLVETLEQLLLQLTEALPHDMNTQIDYDCDLETAMIKGNRTLFCLAILDVLNNSLEDLAEAGLPSSTAGKILVKMESDDKIGAYVITINDNGSGMNELTLSQCHMPFFTTKDSSVHHGLGLNVTTAIVLAMGGTFSIDSIKDQGTSVVMTFPYKK